MKKALLWAGKPFDSEIIFDPKSKYNSDGLLEYAIALKKQFALHGIDLVAENFHVSDEFAFYLFVNIDRVHSKEVDKDKSYLILLEAELILPWNWHLENHKLFRKIFTWNENFIDAQKYFKFHMGRSGTVEWLPFRKRKKLCTMISANKFARHPLELYTLRKEYIDYFEDGKEEYFEFFGMGWDKYVFSGPRWSRFLNRFPSIQRRLARRYRTYRGLADRKLDTLKHYKFSICFENARDLPDGHVSEKIYDSLAAGCIPVYLGAHNITDYVPANCFLDYRDFKTKDQLFERMKNMSESEFNGYLENIRTYLRSDLYHHNVDPGYNASVVVREIMKDVEGSSAPR